MCPASAASFAVSFAVLGPAAGCRYPQLRSEENHGSYLTPGSFDFAGLEQVGLAFSSGGGPSAALRGALSATLMNDRGNTAFDTAAQVLLEQEEQAWQSANNRQNGGSSSTGGGGSGGSGGAGGAGK